MIRDVKEAAILTSQWISLRASLARTKSLVVGVSGGIDSAVVAGLCNLTGLHTVGVIMPCHSTAAAIARAEEVIKTFEITRHFVNLELAHDAISKQIEVSPADNDMLGRKDSADSALRSCLRAPTLDYVSKLHDGIIVGTGNRDEDEVTRYFQKRGDGAVDISPIAKFHKSEIRQLAQYLGVPKSVLAAKPSADLLGPDSGQEDEKDLGLTYDEVEWGMQFAQKYSKIPLFVTGGVSAKHLTDALSMAEALDVRISERQRDVVFALAKMESASRHKANPALPVFDARVELGLDEEVTAA